jgi:hypothetical protein
MGSTRVLRPIKNVNCNVIARLNACMQPSFDVMRNHTWLIANKAVPCNYCIIPQML